MEGPNCYFKDEKTGEEYIGVPKDAWALPICFVLWFLGTMLPLIMVIPLQGWGK